MFAATHCDRVAVALSLRRVAVAGSGFVPEETGLVLTRVPLVLAPSMVYMKCYSGHRLRSHTLSVARRDRACSDSDHRAVLRTELVAFGTASVGR